MSWKMTAEELLERYAAGERDFAGVDLYGVDLSNAVLTEINLDRADLSGVNFSGANLSGAYGQRRTPFSEFVKITHRPSEYSSSALGTVRSGYSCIRYAVLRDAVFHNADIRYVAFSRSDLSYCNFRDSDMSYALFDSSDLSYANFSWAYGDGVFFESACLFCAEFKDNELGIWSLDGANVEGTILEP